MLLIILLVVVVVLVIYAISSQRKFVKLEELVNNALSQIDVQQTSRWDALTQLANSTGSYAKHESETLKDVIAARRPVGPAKSAKEVEANENAFAEALSSLNVLVENYPVLKASSLYRDTMAAIEKYEENVRKSRMVYNDTVTKFNRMVKQIPSNIVASMFGFKEKDYLELDKAKQDMPDLKF